MKTRLFNNNGRCNPAARELLKNSGLKEALDKLIEACKENDLCLHDASGVAHQAVFFAFGKALYDAEAQTHDVYQYHAIETRTIKQIS